VEKKKKNSLTPNGFIGKEKYTMKELGGSHKDLRLKRLEKQSTKEKGMLTFEAYRKRKQ